MLPLSINTVQAVNVCVGKNGFVRNVGHRFNLDTVGQRPAGRTRRWPPGHVGLSQRLWMRYHEVGRHLLDIGAVVVKHELVGSL